MSKKIEITRTVKVKINYTAEDWELFTDEDHIAASTVAANLINETIENAVNAGDNRVVTYRKATTLMDKLSKTGAADTEPYCHLGYLLDKIFGDED